MRVWGTSAMKPNGLCLALPLSGMWALLAGCPAVQPLEPAEVTVSASTTQGKVPLTVGFFLSWSVSPQGRVVSASWDFGDGTYSRAIPFEAATSVRHTFAEPGVYDVRVMVFTEDGELVSNTVRIVASAGQSPTARISGPTGRRIAMDTAPLRFDGRDSSDPDGWITAYHWEFGDGATASGAVVEHTYRASGDFVVRLRVTDDSGNTATASKIVHIAKPQVRMVIEIAQADRTILLELDAARAPLSVENFLRYVDDGFYDGRDGQGATIFHRIEPWTSTIPLVQGGGMTIEHEPKETREPIKNEAANGLSNMRGTIGMARTEEWDSATSQFYINAADNTDFDGRYAVFGKVIEGMEAIDAMLDLPVEGTSPVNPPVIKLAERYRP